MSEAGYVWQCSNCGYQTGIRLRCPRCQSVSFNMACVIERPVQTTQAKTAMAYGIEGPVQLTDGVDVDRSRCYAFTDGATRGAYAAVILYRDRVHEHVRYVRPLPMKNVSAEVMGVALAIRHAPKNEHVIVVSDYLGTGMWLAGHWKVRNRDAILRLSLIGKLIRDRGLTVTFIHHKGHGKDGSGFTRWNCRADELCAQRPKELK